MLDNVLKLGGGGGGGVPHNEKTAMDYFKQ